MHQFNDNDSFSKHGYHSSTSQQFCRQDSESSYQGSDSMSLGQHQQRRHSASMTAAPLRSGLAKPFNPSNEQGLFKQPRAASWTAATDIAANYGRSFSHASDGANSAYSDKVAAHGWFSRRVFRNNKREALGWVFLACLIVTGYKFFSDGSFSAILTLASAFQCFALALLFSKVTSQQSVSGVSMRSLFLVCLCLVLRLGSTLFFNGYLPVDRSGDWVYQFADIVSVVVIGALISYAMTQCRTSVRVQHEKDTCIVAIPIIIALVLALLVHPSLNQNFVADVAWTAGLYIETFAMVPQLFLMGKAGGEVETLTSHYVASMATSKIFAFLFWYFSYAELTPRGGGRNVAGWAVIAAYGLQAVLFLDFFYYYVKSFRIGRRMLIEF